MPAATDLGSGRHIKDIPPDTVVLLLKVGLSGRSTYSLRSCYDQQLILIYIQSLLATQLSWCVSVGLVKLGILLLYLRIFTTDKQERLATYIMMGVAIFWMLSSVLGAFFQCRPLSYIWNHHQDGTCTARIPFWISIGVSHIVIDVLILLLPVRMVWKLHVPPAKKIGLYILFGLGSW